MVKKRVDKSTRGNNERSPKKPNLRDFAEISLRETIQHHASGKESGETSDGRTLVIEIRIKDGITYEEAKEKILDGIKAVFQSDSAIESLDLENVKVRSDFKKTLRAVRKSNLLSQVEMAERLGVSRDYISRLERGRKPGLGFLKKLVEEFGLSIKDVCQPVLRSNSSIERNLNIIEAGEDFKQIFRKVRKVYLLTQAEMAERLGVSRDWISRIERGSHKPGVRLQKKLVEEFGLSIEDLHRLIC